MRWSQILPQILPHCLIIGLCWGWGLGGWRMVASSLRSLLPRALRHQTSDFTEQRHPAALPRQMCAITQARLTSAPFIYLNKITIRFIASRGKTSQGWNWSPILLNVDPLSWRQWRTEDWGNRMSFINFFHISAFLHIYLSQVLRLSSLRMRLPHRAGARHSECWHRDICWEIIIALLVSGGKKLEKWQQECNYK